MIIDLFAGGGGASLGIEAATGRHVDVAINHSATALAVHAANHPKTRHLTTDIWEVKPRSVTRGRPVELLWASPDCTHFSVAKGGKPREKGIRSLAWVVVEWARAVRPACIFLENVAEFRTWGPLGADDKPDRARMGETFEQWRGSLELLGYTVDHRILDASLYGSPTKRKRLFLVARCDGRPIRWPEPTHGPGLLPLHTAAECVDWSLPCPSIFERKRPLAEKTLWRIAQGLKRFVFDTPTPFLIKVNHGGPASRFESLDAPMSTVTASRRGHAVVAPIVAGPGGRAGQSRATGGAQPVGTITAKNDRILVAPTLIQTGYGERPGQRPRFLDLHEPLGTVMGGGQKHALVTAFLAKHYGGSRPGRPGSTLNEPVSTITAWDHHSFVAVTLATFRGTDPSQPGSAPIDAPLPTISAGGIHAAEVRAFLTKYKAARRGARVAGQFAIGDIGMRMLEPHELLRAQFGRFAQAYDMSLATTKAAQVRLIGNSVCPEVAEALVSANLPKEARRVA